MWPRAAFDLHVHTALSPCGGEEMGPPAILLSAERCGIRALGVVDHNTARNAWAFRAAAEAFDVQVLVGLEIETAEGVHVLVLFDEVDAAMDMDRVVAEHLPGLPNRPDILGEQQLLDQWGDVIGIDGRLLMAATDLSLEEVAALAAERGGVSIPAHIDRSPNGLLPVLGFLPPGLEVELLELSIHTPVPEAIARWPELAGRPLVTGSDAHYLSDIGRGASWASWASIRDTTGVREWARCVAQELRARDD